ncbi:aminopeptidase N [Tessaracoccus sp. SD287]|uniref:aminopeptidase N n=1 Tax=Tessaracoccus sp. SD287 TaxID=2782008 RepID=UPI001A971AA0|nr:aminopeptidase N [Tessaracoccus sp. SD287]MBO1031461.1 aminopeptidase N [Tessaracoccus sp. SD287]
MTTSLRRDEAATRARTISEVHADVSLDLGTGATFTSHTVLTFTAVAGHSTFADIATGAVHAVLNGAPVPPEQVTDGRIRLDDLAERNTLEVTAELAYSNDGEALHRHVDASDGRTYLYAMSFLDAAPRWFACFDQPDLKATYQFTVTVPEDDWIVRGNAPVASHQGRRWTLERSRPLSSYFVTLVAGPYAALEHTHDDIRLELLARASMRAELDRAADDLFAVTRDCFDAYHELFGVRYPFGDYVQAFVPDFNAGAMENPGCVVLRDQVLFRGAATRAEVMSRAGLVAHEMAHQWFGDLVTMRWWDDLWLNESFAEYMAHRVITATGRADLWIDFGITRKNWGAEADQGPGSHPIAGNGAEDAQTSLENFDGISYAKGASALRQLVTLMGDDVFLSGLRAYFERYAYANASAAELLACWTEAGAQGLDDWAAQWLLTQDMDVLGVDPGDQPAILRLAPEQHPARRTHAIEVAGLAADGTEIFRTPIVVAGDRQPLPAPDQAAVLVPDAGDQTWARIRPSVPFAQLPVISSVADPATRVVLYNALRDGVRHAEVGAGAALEALLASLVGEREPGIVAAMLVWALDLSGDWIVADERATARARLADVAQRLLEAAPAGSDQQLAAARGLLAASSDLDLLTDWLAGSRLPQGLGLDQDLRWLAVHRLVMLGADPVVIGDEYARDHTSSGRVAARRARTALPDAEAKREALSLLVAGEDLGNYELYAIAENLFLPEQHALTADMVDDWARGVRALAETRTGWVLPRLVKSSAPTSHASATTRAVLVDLEEDPALSPVLVRPVAEALARTDQILAAQRPGNNAQMGSRPVLT